MRTRPNAICALSVLCMSIASTPLAKGAITFSQAGDNITMSITNETFTITSNQGTASAAGIVIFDIFSTAGPSTAGSVVSGGLTYSINGGSPTVAANWGGWQYRTGNQGVLTDNDAAYIISLPANSWSIGDAVTINAELVMSNSLNPANTLPDLYTSTSQTALFGGSGPTLLTATRDVGAVPEPSSLFIASLGSMALIARRRRRR